LEVGGVVQRCRSERCLYFIAGGWTKWRKERERGGDERGGGGERRGEASGVASPV
jgi:hypothetical protein